MKLKHKRATQDSDIKTQICFAEYLYMFLIETIELSKFSSSLKQANIIPVFKRGTRN